MRSFLSELKCYHSVLVHDLSALNVPGNRLLLIGWFKPPINRLIIFKIDIRIGNCKNIEERRTELEEMKQNDFKVYLNYVTINRQIHMTS